MLNITDRHNAKKVWHVEYKSRNYYLSQSVSGNETAAPRRVSKSHIEDTLDITLEKGAASFEWKDKLVLTVEETEKKIARLSKTAKAVAARLDTERSKNLQVREFGASATRRKRRVRVLRKLKAHLYNARQRGLFDNEREIRNAIKQVRAGA